MQERRQFVQQPEKLAEAVVYLCQRSSGDPYFGETKLVKLLYYADCDAYQRTGEPFTGSTYLHYPNGPYPERWTNIKDRMETAGDIAVATEEVPGGYERKRTMVRRPVKPGILSEDDIAALDRQIERFAAFNAGEMMTYSHREVAWRATQAYGPMPYELSKFSAPEVDDYLIEEAKRIIGEESRRRADLQSS